MEFLKHLSVKKQVKSQKIGEIYDQISSGLKENTLSFEVIKEKIDEAYKLIRQIEQRETESYY